MAVAEKHLQIVQGGSLQQFSREQIDTIKRTVAKGVTDAELEMFLTLCARYQLDPFLKEIWCYKRQKKGPNGQYVDDPNAPAIIMTSRDGYLKVAQRDENFDGLKSFVVREGDDFEIDAINDTVKHKFGSKRGKIIGAWAICYHKTRRPVICFVDHNEYNAGSQVWNKYPSAMIQKVAEGFALKRQFGISGLVTHEEMQSDFIDIPATEVDTGRRIEQPKQDTKARWKAKAEELSQIATEAGVDGPALREVGLAVVEKDDPTKWSITDMDSIISYLSDLGEGESVDGTQHAGEEPFELPPDDQLPF
ncbi:phage recombination protein Bet [Alicyclobacillus fastidiosus]|uniref:Phage recombination protein Bet n=1 Tax=Alicyclobacillus fastidiosus TaxID=392011 RepID=A0ABV5AKJ8_9BACL|nr:phage recombination protein Bet [Alicyclobacillus fastidiosus]WEH09305.1 phage recombination protein Bet [Alicyclobacillus fastidiosus]